MTVIFRNFDSGFLKETAGKILRFIKTNKITLYITYCLMAVAAVVITAAAAGITLGYTVNYSGRVIALVSSESDYDEADAIVVETLDKKTAQAAAAEPEFGMVLTISDKFSTAREVADAIIDNNENIEMANALYVDGEVAVCVKEDCLQEMLDGRLKDYYKEDAENESEFTNKVEVKSGYYLKSDIVSREEAQELVSELEVKTISVVKTRTQLSYGTKTVYSNKQSIGSSQVTTQGENGISEKAEEIVTVNGKTQTQTELYDKVIKEAVDKVVTVGTASNSYKTVSSGFIKPLSGRYTITSYYGDGRNHKGIDFAADMRTPILAVASGTVIYSGYDGDYGYNVIIEHSSGIRTRYAHASALCVSAGDKVSQGEMIATVGSTGWSTGSHLHFEVIINGSRVNPAPYLGF